MLGKFYIEIRKAAIKFVKHEADRLNSWSIKPAPDRWLRQVDESRSVLSSFIKNRTISRNFFLKFLIYVLLNLTSTGQLRAQSAATIDLSTWNGQSIMELTGPWDLYWNQFIKPSLGWTEADAKAPAGRSWNGIVLKNGQTLGAVGYASYRLVLKGLKPRPEGYLLSLDNVSVSYSLQIYDSKDLTKVIGQIDSGRVAVEKQGEVPSKHARNLPLLPSVETDYVVVIHISNHSYSTGGLWHTPTLANPKIIQHKNQLILLLDIFSLGVTLSLGIYNLMIWYRNRIERAAFYLALCALMVCCRNMSTSASLNTLCSDAFYSTWRAFEFMSLPAAGVSYFLFLRHLFFPKFWKNFGIAASIVAIGLCLFCLFTAEAVFSEYLHLFQIYIASAAIVSAAFIIRAYSLKLTGSGLAMFSIPLCVLPTIIDLLISMKYIPMTFYIAPVGVAVFFILQAQIIAARAEQNRLRAEQLSQQLIEQEKARTLFFHNTSHELRTPLNGIIGFLDLVRQGRYGELSASAKAQIGKALRLAESLKIQVNTILDLAKSKRGELKARNQQFSLAELKAESDGLAEGLCLKAADITYDSKLESDFDNFIADREKVFTIIRNLLGNAFKFRAAHRPHHVHLKLAMHQQKLTISVRDNGIGIPESFREKIFEEFGQVDADARRSYEGTGLGLSMVRDLVKMFGGHIRVQSELNAGSTFIVEIPEQTLSELSSDMESPQNYDRFIAGKDEPKSPQNESGRTDPVHAEAWEVSVIDDNETNCEVISAILGIDGYSIRTALSGRSGLDQMRLSRPNLLLLDMMMPEMSGEDVLNEMRKDPLLQEIPVILITARASEEDRVLGLKLGADDYLPKPIFAAELRLRVHNMMERHRLLRLIERSAQDDKLKQLGELFSELSLELKHSLQGSTSMEELNEGDGRAATQPLTLSSSSKQALADALVSPPRDQTLTGYGVKLDPGPHDSARKMRNAIRANILDLPLSFEDLQNIWLEVLSKNEDELRYLATQSKIFVQYKILLQQLRRSKDLTQGLLGYMHQDAAVLESDAQAAWTDTQLLLQPKFKKSRIRLMEELSHTLLPISQSVLTQAFINPTLYALEELAQASDENRWICIRSQQNASQQCIELSYGLPTTGLESGVSLFQNGFSAQGNARSSSLNITRRLLLQARAHLTFSSEAAQSKFVIQCELTRKPSQVIPPEVA